MNIKWSIILTSCLFIVACNMKASNQNVTETKVGGDRAIQSTVDSYDGKLNLNFKYIVKWKKKNSKKHYNSVVELKNDYNFNAKFIRKLQGGYELISIVSNLEPKDVINSVYKTGTVENITRDLKVNSLKVNN